MNFGFDGLIIGDWLARLTSGQTSILTFTLQTSKGKVLQANPAIAMAAKRSKVSRTKFGSRQRRSWGDEWKTVLFVAQLEGNKIRRRRRRWRWWEWETTLRICKLLIVDKFTFGQTGSTRRRRLRSLPSDCHQLPELHWIYVNPNSKVSSLSSDGSTRSRGPGDRLANQLVSSRATRSDDQLVSSIVRRLVGRRASIWLSHKANDNCRLCSAGRPVAIIFNRRLMQQFDVYIYINMMHSRRQHCNTWLTDKTTTKTIDELESWQRID